MLSIDELKSAYNGCKEGGHLGALRAVAEAAVKDARCGILLEVIQSLNGNPYSLTKNECIELVSAMRKGSLIACAGCEMPQCRDAGSCKHPFANPPAVKDAVGGDEPVAWARNLTDPRPDTVTDLIYCSVAEHERGDTLSYIPLYTRPQASAAVPEELIEMADRFGCIAHMYNGMKRSTAERFLECLGHADLPIGWESMTLPRLLAALAASQPEVKS